MGKIERYEDVRVKDVRAKTFHASFFSGRNQKWSENVDESELSMDWSFLTFFDFFWGGGFCEESFEIQVGLIFLKVYNFVNDVIHYIWYQKF